MHKYPEKGESLQEFNFEFSERIQAREPKDITDLLKIFLYAQTFFNPVISLKISGMHIHPCKMLYHTTTS